jgi:hypothetical protein
MILSLPLLVQTSLNNILILNINNYRNAHHQVLNKAKIKFKEEIKKINRKFKQFKLIYTLYANNNRSCNTNNICSIVDKFFYDALTKAKIIKDDSYKYLIESTFKWGCVDENNPRGEVQIIKVKE